MGCAQLFLGMLKSAMQNESHPSEAPIQLLASTIPSSSGTQTQKQLCTLQHADLKAILMYTCIHVYTLM
eukprot:1158426-Pelagomonas_calceolata.AAC.10